MKIFNQNTGQSLVEFGLVMALVGVGLVFALLSLKPATVKQYFRNTVAPSGHIEANGQLVVPTTGG